MTNHSQSHGTVKDTYIVPMNAMIRLGDIPASKKRDKIIEELGEDFLSMEMMVPDPRRGTKLTGHALKLALKRREEQAAKVAKKRTQRRNFRALDKKTQHLHRQAGTAHLTPGEYLVKMAGE